MSMSLNTRINLDANATFGVTPAVKSALIKYLSQNLGNPSSVYQTGQAARVVVEDSRHKLALLIGEQDLRRIDITFTSGATEANNWGLGAPFFDGLGCSGQEMVVLAVEHPSVTGAAAYWQSRGVDVHYAYPLNNEYPVSRLLELVTPATRIVSIMSANNETGHRYPTAELSSAIRAKYPGVLIHIDAVQSLGKEPLSFWNSGADTMALSGHKIGALSGIGALVTKKSNRISPMLIGGAQEVRRRAGTENLPGIFSFGAAAEETLAKLSERISAMARSRRIIEEVFSDSTSIELISRADGLPNTISARFKGVSAPDLVVALDLKGIEVSFGSACASGKQDHSPVLTAIGLTAEQAQEVVRISVRGDEDPQALRIAAQMILETANQMRGAHA
jgi:cysteine desulfurase